MKKKYREHFSGRSSLDAAQLSVAFGVSGAQRETLAACLEAIETETGISRGLLRPDDRIETVLGPGRRSPVLPSFRGFSALETATELNYQLQSSRKERGLEATEGVINTVGEFVHAWCEAGDFEKRSRQSE